MPCESLLLVYTILFTINPILACSLEIWHNQTGIPELALLQEAEQQSQAGGGSQSQAGADPGSS